MRALAFAGLAAGATSCIGPREDLVSPSVSDATPVPLDAEGTGLLWRAEGDWEDVHEAVREAAGRCMIVVEGFAASRETRRVSGLEPGSVIGTPRPPLFDPLPVSVLRELAAPPGPDDQMHFDLRALRGDRGWVRAIRSNSPRAGESLVFVAVVGLGDGGSREACLQGQIGSLLREASRRNARR